MAEPVRVGLVGAGTIAATHPLADPGPAAADPDPIMGVDVAASIVRLLEAGRSPGSGGPRL